MSESNEQALKDKAGDYVEARLHLAHIFDGVIPLFLGWVVRDAYIAGFKAAKASTPQPQTVREAKNSAYKEAAELCIQWGNARKDKFGGNALRNCAEAIRALIAPLSAADSVAVQEPKITRQQLEQFAKLMSYSIEEAYDTYSLLLESLGKPAAPTLDKEEKK